MNSSANALPKAEAVPLHGLSAIRTLVILAIAMGYASTMALGTDSAEIGKHWGYDPSWFGLQVLFAFSGFLAARSLLAGRSAQDFFLRRARRIWVPLLIVTGWVVLILFPVLCAAEMRTWSAAPTLSAYFLKTIFLIEPGGRLPGLLDEAKYACLIQGAIWTLRWGLVAHIGMWALWQIKLLRSAHILAIAALGLIGAYVGIVYWAVHSDAPNPLIVSLIPGLRLGCAYIGGAALYMWRERLPKNGASKMLTLAALLVITTALYKAAPWTPMIEIFGAAFWVYACIVGLQSAPKSWAKWPRLEPALYVSMWPIAQIVVLTAPALSQSAIIFASLAFALSAAGIVWMMSQGLRKGWYLSQQTYAPAASATDRR